VYHSTLCSRVIKKKKKEAFRVGPSRTCDESEDDEDEGSGLEGACKVTSKATLKSPVKRH